MSHQRKIYQSENGDSCGCVLKKPDEFAFYMKPTLYPAARPQSWKLPTSLAKAKLARSIKLSSVCSELAKVD